MPDPVPTTGAPAPAAPATTTPPAAPAGAAPVADAKPPEPAPPKLARQRLEEVTKAKREAAAATEKLTATKLEVEPLVKKAQEFEADKALAIENPKAWLEKHGIDANAVTEKLAAQAIEDIESKTPAGQMAALQKQIDDMKAADAKRLADANEAAAEKNRDAFRDTLVKAIEPTKYPLTANAADGLVEPAEMRKALFEIGRQLWNKKTEGMNQEQKGKAVAPTVDEILAECEARYQKVHAALNRTREPVAPVEEKKGPPPKTQMAPSLKLKDRKAKAHEELRKKFAAKK